MKMADKSIWLILWWLGKLSLSNDQPRGMANRDKNLIPGEKYFIMLFRIART